MKYTNRDIKEFKNYVIDCYSWETQSNWGHKVEIYPAGDTLNIIASNKTTYYNRTWECYRYQSCILGAIWGLIDFRKARLIDIWKANNGKKRATKEEKEMAVAGDDLLAEYNEMYEYFKSEYKGF